MNDHQQAQLKNLLADLGVTNIPDLSTMTNEELRQYLKATFVEILQNYKDTSFVEKAFCLKELLMPHSIFQYRSFDDAGYKVESLKNNYVWLSKPKDFNDPYDCAGCFDMEKTLENLLREKQHNGDISKILNRHKNLSNTTQKILESSQAKLKNALQQKVKISCFSETYNNILMWSHYAQSHTGFCIEYNISNLELTNSFKKKLFPVFYTPKPIDMSKAILSEQKEIFEKILIINKSEDWKYEREWRYITSSEDDSKFIMPVKPKAIYLGTKISEENKNIMLKIANNEYQIPCYELQPQMHSFKLEIARDISLL